MNRFADGARPSASIPAADAAAAVAVVSCGDRNCRLCLGAGATRGEAEVRAARTALDLLYGGRAVASAPVTASPVRVKAAGCQPAGTALGAGPHGTLPDYPGWPSCRGGAAPCQGFVNGYRCRQPADTLATFSALLTWAGARVRDASWLAPLGFPVAVAAAPRAPGPRYCIGAGATRTGAMVSAAGRMLECWHAEHAVPPASLTGSAADAAAAGYQIAGAEASEERDWVEGWSFPSGRRALAPRDQVIFRPPPGQSLVLVAPAGLAVGNTRYEAIAHAVYELIAAEARASRTGRRSRQYFDACSIPGAWSTEVVSRVGLAGGHVEAARVPSPYGVPCFSAILRFDGDAETYEGTAAHCDPGLAMSTALAKALASKITRAAVPALWRWPGRRPGRAAGPPASTRPAAAWDDVAVGGWACHSDQEAAASAARRVTAAAGGEPVVIDLAKSRDFAAVKVLFVPQRPGARHPPDASGMPGARTEHHRRGGEDMAVNWT